MSGRRKTVLLWVVAVGAFLGLSWLGPVLSSSGSDGNGGGAMGLVLLWQNLLWPLIQLVLFVLVVRRLARFLNTVEARTVALDEKLARIDEQGLKRRGREE